MAPQDKNPYSPVPRSQRIGYFTPPVTLSSTDFIDKWHVCGPFIHSNTPAVYTRSQFTNNHAQLYLQSNGNNRVWTQINSSLLSFHTMNYPTTTYASAYALSYIYSPSNTRTHLCVGSDDGCVAWLNGKEIINTGKVQRPCNPTQERVTVALHKGWNPLLLKIVQYEQQWQTSAACVDAQDTGLRFSSTPDIEP